MGNKWETVRPVYPAPSRPELGRLHKMDISANLVFALIMCSQNHQLHRRLMALGQGR